VFVPSLRLRQTGLETWARQVLNTQMLLRCRHYIPARHESRQKTAAAAITLPSSPPSQSQGQYSIHRNIMPILCHFIRVRQTQLSIHFAFSSTWFCWLQQSRRLFLCNRPNGEPFFPTDCSVSLFCRPFNTFIPFCFKGALSCNKWCSEMRVLWVSHGFCHSH
jgi:hypothetical protein